MKCFGTKTGFCRIVWEALRATGPCKRGWQGSAAAGSVPGCGKQTAILDAGSNSWQRCPASPRQDSLPYKLWRALPTLAVQSLSLLLPGFIIHPSFVFLMLWGSSQLLHYCKNGPSLLQNISQHPGVSDESGLAPSKQHPWGWGH